MSHSFTLRLAYPRGNFRPVTSEYVDELTRDPVCTFWRRGNSPFLTGIEHESFSL
jgi:hypothetical protein